MVTLPVADLVEGMIVERSIYTDESGLTPLLIKGTMLTQPLIRKLIFLGVRSVTVDGEPEPAKVYVPPPAPLLDEALREEAIGAIEDLFAVVREGENQKHMTTAYQVVKQIDMVVDDLVASLSNDKRALVNIGDLKSYDEYTYHHSLSVAVLSIAIGQGLGFSGAKLNLIGKAAMLHDIGKTAIPVGIINKPSRLTDEEFTTIKRHSPEGYQYLVDHNIGGDELLQGVLCHHEKVNGKGYPFGLKGNDVPLLSRIIAVADVYDALTSYRSYRSPMQPADATELIMGDVGEAFDFDIVTTFIKKLALYPVGSIVELSDGRAAFVVNNENAMRPVVMTVDTGETLDLFSDRRCLSLTIRRMMEEHETGALRYVSKQKKVSSTAVAVSL